ncbi:MAG: copper amine oxidase N-terminal domain-containing protein [Defluviitaleaceae bacterium]|nr:copper amine oxidase N-terminal domain-containing protein [Defluviitaleaceae bacterium]
MRKTMKLSVTTLALALVLGLCVFSPTTTYAADIGVTINGTAVVFDGQGPTIVDGRTLVPVRGVFEVLGFEVGWLPGPRTATLNRQGFAVRITVGAEFFTVNDTPFSLEVPAQIINGRTLLPIRAVLEAVGYYVDWDSTSRTVLVASEPFEPTEAEDLEGYNPIADWRMWHDIPFSAWQSTFTLSYEGDALGISWFYVTELSVAFSFDYGYTSPENSPGIFISPIVLFLGAPSTSVAELRDMFANDEFELVFDDYFDEWIILVFTPDYAFRFRLANENDTNITSVWISRNYN